MVENHKVVAEVVAVFQKSLQKLTSEKFCITIIFNRLHRFLFKRSLQNTLQIFKTHCVFPSPPRQGVPRRAEAFVLCLAVLGRYHSATGTVRTSLCLLLH